MAEAGLVDAVVRASDPQAIGQEALIWQEAGQERARESGCKD
jgi:hypothetical protein